MSFIEVRNLWKEYGDNVVLEKIQLSIEQGEFCTIVGASGCGKTTFLKILLGEEQPSKGEILLEGKPLPNEPSEERGIVFQRYSVFPHLSVLQNVMIGLELSQSPILGRLFGAQKKVAVEQAQAMIAEVGLTQASDKYPSELSGGMQQRLAIAQSLIMKPRILLLDEPFGALDPGIRADMHELILKLWQEFNITVFMITHDIKEGFHLGTRLLVFDKTRNDPQAPNAFGASITYDLPVSDQRNGVLQEINESAHETAKLRDSLPVS